MSPIDHILVSIAYSINLVVALFMQQTNAHAIIGTVVKEFYTLWDVTFSESLLFLQKGKVTEFIIRIQTKNIDRLSIHGLSAG